MSVWTSTFRSCCGALAVSLLMAATPALAQEAAPPPPTLAARSWLLFDQTTGQVLASHLPDERIEPASLAKMMTAYVTFNALRDGKITLDQEVPVSENARKQEGSRMFIEPRRAVTVEQLLHGVIIQSGNDACVALAELIAGSEEAFTHLMNAEAKRLGMATTHFANSTGLPHAELYTTARDLAALATALVKDYPQYYTLYSQREYTYNNIKQPNRNRLLWLDSTVDGMKTGHTKSAGYCLVASANRADRRLISVLLGAESEAARAQESLKLLNYGYQFFEAVKLYDAGQALSQIRVYKGVDNDVPVGFDDDFKLSLPSGAASRVQVALTSVQPVIAPIRKGDPIATLSVTLDGQQIGEYHAVALKDVELAGFFGRTWDSTLMWFKSL